MTGQLLTQPNEELNPLPLGCLLMNKYIIIMAKNFTYISMHVNIILL